MSACVHANTVDWMGLTWQLKGANTTAVVNSEGHLGISVLGGQTNQDQDNWNVYATLPDVLKKENALGLSLDLLTILLLDTLLEQEHLLTHIQATMNLCYKVEHSLDFPTIY
ncbi:MAG: hypothetical protein SNJ70_04365 [Armatimonadota bacterium]